MLINSSLGGMKTKTTMVIFVMSCLLAVQAQPNNGQSHVNDFFHCENPKNIDKKTQIKCDKNTFEWALDELDPEGPPEICGEDYVVSGQPASMPGPGEVADALEPCLLWSIFFGSLSTGTPTIAPTTIESTNPTGPTDPPTTEDGEDGGLCKSFVVVYLEWSRSSEVISFAPIFGPKDSHICVLDLYS